MRNPEKTPAMASLTRDHGHTIGELFVDNARIQCRGVDVYYGEKQAITDVSLDVGRNEVIALIGPSGCGKSTFLRCLNRMNDTIVGCRVSGEIKLDGNDIYAGDLDVVPLRAAHNAQQADARFAVIVATETNGHVSSRERWNSRRGSAGAGCGNGLEHPAPGIRRPLEDRGQQYFVPGNRNRCRT